MAKKSIFSRMLEAFAKDAEPEEIVEAAKAVDKACSKDEEPELKEKAEVETRDEDMEMVMDAIHELNEKIEAMRNENSAHHKEEAEDKEPKLTGLDAVEAAIKERMSQDSDDGEEEVEVDPEAINAEDEEPEEEEEEEAEVIESEDEEPEEEEEVEVEEKTKAADAAISLAMLRAIKPIVASMPTAQRKRATDALDRAVKKAMKTAPSQPLPGGYGALTKRRKTVDAATNEANLRAFGEACRKRNPHNQK